MLDIASVWPSGRDLTTEAVPTLVLAPGRLSTMNLWPSRLPRPSASRRARTSVPPPAANGTTISTVRHGHLPWGAAGHARIELATASVAARTSWCRVERVAAILRPLETTAHYRDRLVRNQRNPACGDGLPGTMAVGTPIRSSPVVARIRGLVARMEPIARSF